MSRHLRVRGVGEEGVDVLTLADHPVDVCVDGRRVWTFWTRRDTVPVGLAGPARWPVRRAVWPPQLQRHLDGRARITVRDSVAGTVHFDRDVSLGGGSGPVEVRSADGVDLGIDKSGRLVPTFAGRSDRDIAALLDATEAVLGALRAAGVEPFLAYGTLLGAVREGAVLGHDSDADLGYVSRWSTPVDVVRESFEVQRRLARDGWRVARYSGAAFKIFVTEGDVTRGLDVFGGFFSAGRLHLMGEVGTEFREEWIRPLGEVRLEGRTMPAPARPEELLEVMYGPGWRVPDPAFRFTTPERTSRALNDWFRGTQPGLRHWERRAAATAANPLREHPSPLARRAREAAAALGAEVLDVGAGRGSDSLWLARQGLAVTAYDYAPRALATARATAAEEGLDLRVRELNLTDWRSVLAEGAALAHRPRPRVVLARHLLDATSEVGRASLARLCSMAMREGGRLYASFYAPGDAVAEGPEDPAEWPEWVVARPEVDRITRLVRDAGAREVEVTHQHAAGRPTVRLVGVW